MSGDLELAGGWPSDDMVALALDAFYPGYTLRGHHKEQRERMRRALMCVRLAEAAATRLEGLQNTVLDDAALREILAEECGHINYNTARDIKAGVDRFINSEAAVRAMSRVSRLQGLRDGVTDDDLWKIIAEENALAGWKEYAAHILKGNRDLAADVHFAVAKRVRALKSPDTETLEALGTPVATTEKP